MESERRPTRHRQVIRRADGRVVGDVVNGVFRKRLKNVHFLTTPRAIAFDVQSLDDAERAGARYAEVTDLETGRVYRAAIAAIRARGFEFNRGFGDQIGLVMSEWNRPDESVAEQLTLWPEAT